MSARLTSITLPTLLIEPAIRFHSHTKLESVVINLATLVPRNRDPRLNHGASTAIKSLWRRLVSGRGFWKYFWLLLRLTYRQSPLWRQTALRRDCALTAREASMIKCITLGSCLILTTL